MGLIPGTVSAQPEAVEFARELGLVGRSLLCAAVVFLGGITVLGLFPTYGDRVLTTARGSSIISAAIGIPMTVALGVVVGAGILLAGNPVGVFFAVPLLVGGGALLLAWLVIGWIAAGAYVARRAGRENRWLGLLIGSIAAGAVAVVPEIGVAVALVVTVVGVGAGTRVTLVGGGISDPDERTVPPANKV